MMSQVEFQHVLEFYTVARAGKLTPGNNRNLEFKRVDLGFQHEIVDNVECWISFSEALMIEVLLSHSTSWLKET